MKIIHRILLTLMLFFPSFSQGIIFIDVDSFNFQDKKGIRVAIFDIDAQKFHHLSYHTFSANDELSQSDLVKNTQQQKRMNFLLPIENIQTTVYEDGCIDIPFYTQPLFNNYIIRTFGGISSAGAPLDTQNNDNKNILSPPNLEVKNGEFIYEKLRFINNNATTPHFDILFYLNNVETGKRILSNLDGHQTNDTCTERGKLGELATEMAMLSFGYVKKSSQFTGGQGFDGVYVSKSTEDPFLFLTESKCRGESCSATNYLEKELNENVIHSRLKSRELSLETKNIVEDFINRNPGRTYKFAHRLLITGHTQCALASFDILAYRMAQCLSGDLSSNAPTEEQESLFSALYPKLGFSPTIALQYVLKSFNLSVLEGIGLLTLQDLSGPQRSNILSYFPNTPTSPLAEQLPPQIDVSAAVPTEISTNRINVASTDVSEVSTLVAKMSLETRETSVVKSTPQKTITPRKRITSPISPKSNIASSPKTPSSPPPNFGDYTAEKLTYFVNILKGGVGGSKGIGRINLMNFYNGYKQSNDPELKEKTFRNLLEGKKVKTGENIWPTYTKNFIALCENMQISSNAFLATWKEKYLILSQALGEQPISTLTARTSPPASPYVAPSPFPVAITPFEINAERYNANFPIGIPPSIQENNSPFSQLSIPPTYFPSQGYAPRNTAPSFPSMYQSPTSAFAGYPHTGQNYLTPVPFPNYPAPVPGSSAPIHGFSPSPQGYARPYTGQNPPVSLPSPNYSVPTAPNSSLAPGYYGKN